MSRPRSVALVLASGLVGALAPDAHAGDVTVSTDAKGVVRITGTEGPDGVSVRPTIDERVVRVAPLAGSTVNGGADPVDVTASGDLRVALGGGDDEFEMPSSGVEIAGRTRIDMGAGAARVSLKGADLGGGLDVRLPRGGGTVSLEACRAGTGGLRVRATDATAPVVISLNGTDLDGGSIVVEGALSRQNRLTVVGGELADGGITWRGGDVDDQVSITGVVAAGRLSLFPGARGTHTTSLVSGEFGDGGSVAGGSGPDSVTVLGTDFYGKGLRVDTGRGGIDDVTVRESQVARLLAVRAARATLSEVRVTGAIVEPGGRAEIVTGKGADRVLVETFTCGGPLTISAGPGDDRLQVDGSRVAGAFRTDGGTGTDRLCDGFDALNTFGSTRAVVRVEEDRRASEGDDGSGCGDGTRRVSVPRISLTQAGGDADGASSVVADSSRSNRVLEEDGEAMAFSSEATNLVAGDTNGGSDVFVASIVNEVLVERVSLTSTGAQFTRDGRGGPPRSVNPSMSAQGRFVAFESTAADAVPDDGNADTDVFLRDRLFGTTVAMSNPAAQDDGNGGTFHFPRAWDPAVSGEGRDVAFVSHADYLDTEPDVITFLDPQVWVAYYSFDGTVFRRRATVRDDGRPADVAFGFSGHPSLSFDGGVCAFHSTIVLTDDAPGPSAYKVYVRDFRAPARTELISVTDQGVPFEAVNPSISDDGNLVCFETAAGLDPADTDGAVDVYLKNRQTGSITWASPDPEGGFAAFGPAPSQSFLAGGGNWVVFSAAGGSTTPEGAFFFHRDIYLFDLQGGTTVETGRGAAGEADGDTRTPSITPNGRWIGFASSGSRFDANRADGNGRQDVWVQDRGGFVAPPPPPKR